MPEDLVSLRKAEDEAKEAELRLYGWTKSKNDPLQGYIYVWYPPEIVHNEKVDHMLPLSLQEAWNYHRNGII